MSLNCSVGFADAPLINSSHNHRSCKHLGWVPLVRGTNLYGTDTDAMFAVTVYSMMTYEKLTLWLNWKLCHVSYKKEKHLDCKLVLNSVICICSYVCVRSLHITQWRSKGGAVPSLSETRGTWLTHSLHCLNTITRRKTLHYKSA